MGTLQPPVVTLETGGARLGGLRINMATVFTRGAFGAFGGTPLHPFCAGVIFCVVGLSSVGGLSGFDRFSSLFL